MAQRKGSEADMGLGARHFCRDDVGGRKGEQLFVGHWFAIGATLGVPDIDALQLVGHETGVAPRLRVAYLIGLGEHVAILLPGLRGEVVLVFVHATSAYLQEVVDGAILELEAIGKA